MICARKYFIWPLRQVHPGAVLGWPINFMMNNSLRFVLTCTFCLLLLAACVRQQHALSAEITTLHNGSLKIPEQADAPKCVYIDTSDSARQTPQLAKYLGIALSHGKFRMAESPSKAGYILHVKVLQTGQTTPEALKKAVNAGYGKKARLRGSGVDAMLVDALMVQRRVPSAKRPSRQRLKNISSRNALGSSQMRIAVMGAVPSGHNLQDDFSHALANELALRMEN